MRTWRWPVLVLIVVFVAAAVAVEHRDQGGGAAQVEASSIAVPEASGPDGLGSTWYCAGGTATADGTGVAEQVVDVANFSDQTARAVATVYPSEGQPASTTFEVAAHDRAQLRASDVVRAPYAAVLVEVDGPQVAVRHELSGPRGRTVGACASAPASDWYLPAGTTRPGTSMLLALFNPFPDDAVVDISFDTDDGTRTPQDFQAMVVKGGGVTVVNVSDVVTLRNDVSTQVHARSGRLVVDEIQTGDGSEGAPAGLAVVLGAPSPAPTWLFPAGATADGRSEAVVVFNPGTDPIDVDVQVLLDDPQTNGVPEPFRITVGGGHRAGVDVFADGRVPAGVAHAIVVSSASGAPVVAARTTATPADAADPGFAYVLGAPLAATRTVVPVASTDGLAGAGLVVFNPSPTDTVTVTVQAVGGGQSQVPPGAAPVDLGPGERRTIDLGTDGLGVGASSLAIDATGPVAVETGFDFADGAGFADLVGVPVVGTLSDPPADIADLSTQAVVLGN